MRTARSLLAALGCLLVSGAALGGEVGAPIDVAPQAPGTQMQTWPKAAWAAESKTWLVVWREGYINEEATDVWAGRVSADGKALDPTGIKVCAAKDRQEHAEVASDGKGWLIVWEDFRNGKDYDVYAARVSAEGKVLDPEGFLVAGGEHNQCQPAVAFAGGNYVVVWQAFVGDYPDGTKDKNGGVSGYRLYGTAVSPEGKVATPGGALLTPLTIGHALRPQAVAAGGQRVLVSFDACVAGAKPEGNNIGTLWVDGATGKPDGVNWQPPKEYNQDNFGSLGRPLSLAWGKEGGLILSFGSADPCDFRVFRVEASGARVLPSAGATKSHQAGFVPWRSIVCDGERYLVTRDRVVKQKPLPMLGVQARLAPADWKGDNADEGFFLVAGDGSKSCLMGQAAGGPKGTFLVTYTEGRGVDDVKVLARIVK